MSPVVQPPPTPPASQDSASEDLFDYELIGHAFGYLMRSVPRHKLLAFSTFVVVVALAVFIAAALPKKYRSESKLLAMRNPTMERMGAPTANPFDQSGPTRAAYETVMARRNLIEMIESTNLLEDWDKSRNPILKFKDKVMQSIGGVPPKEVQVDNMVDILVKRLFVTAGEGTGTVDIMAIWPSPQMARRLVETAQQNFLEARHVSEVSALSEAISILELHVGQQQEQVNQALATLQRVREDRRRGVVTKPASAEAPKVTSVERPAPGMGSNQELTQLRSLIRAKRRAYADLEEARARRLADLQGQLAEANAIYAANHPNVLEIQERISALQKDSLQAAAVRREEEALVAQFKGLGGRDSDLQGDSPMYRGGGRSSGGGVTASVVGGPDEDPEVEMAEDRLGMAMASTQDLQRRLDAARIELDTARAAFKYRYTVVSPALTPRRPDSPNVMLITIAGMVAGIALAFLVCVAVDLRRGRVLEAWEVQRRLELPLLADLKR